MNVMHYGAGAWMGPHLDLKEKIATHVLQFNQTWNKEDGGCLRILNANSTDPSAVAAEVSPIIGSSTAIVRSDHSWHMVAKVAQGCPFSRRSTNVSFHLPGSVSSMWPPGENGSLHDFEAIC